MMFDSLRTKIFLVLTAGIIGLIATLMLALSFNIHAGSKELYTQQAETVVKHLKEKTHSLFELGLKPNELLGYEKLCESVLAENEAFDYVALTDAVGNPFYHAGTPHAHNQLQPNYHKALSDPDHTVITSLQHPLGFKTHIIVSLNHDFESAKVMELLVPLLIYVFCASAVGLLIMLYFLKNHFVKPIGQLVEHIKGIDIDHISTESTLIDRKDELGFVARLFNQIMARLAQSQESYRKANTELMALADSLEHRVEERTLELKKANERLDAIAKTDVLSGLGNRLQFIEIFNQRFTLAKRHQKNFAVLMIDLDGFKLINDQHGHAAGDTVLETIGQRLKNSFRASDSAFRVGGDEFILLAEEYKSQSDLMTFADKIINRIKEPIIVDNLHLTIGASIGIARLEQYNGIEAHSFLSLADASMYKAKRNDLDFTFADE